MTSVILVEIYNDRGVRHLVRNRSFLVPMCRMQGANETVLRPRRGLAGLSCLWCMALLTRARVSAPR
jgi:hypothetical protein